MSGEVIYHIFLDRFYNPSPNWTEVAKGKEDQPVRCGGSLKGVREKVPLFVRSGYSAILLTPWLKNEAYHGYHTTDLMSVDPSFGTTEDIKALADDLHRRGIKLFMDLVPNHVGCQHPFFQDALSKGEESPYFDYFCWKNREKREPFNFLSCGELIKLNLTYPPCKEHVLGSVRFWQSLGVDGFRVDHCLGPDPSFYPALLETVRAEDPECVVFGEAWLDPYTSAEDEKTLNVPYQFFVRKAQHLLMMWWVTYPLRFDPGLVAYRGKMDGVLDFTFLEVCLAYLESPMSWFDYFIYLLRLLLHWVLTLQFLNFFPCFRPFVLYRFLSNHDMDRISYKLGNSQIKLVKAYELLFQYSSSFSAWAFSLLLRVPVLQGLAVQIMDYWKAPSNVVVYYGDDIAMLQARGVHDQAHHGDLACRQVYRGARGDMPILKIISHWAIWFRGMGISAEHLKRGMRSFTNWPYDADAKEKEE